MAALKAGDRVKIADRPATPQDLKSGLFFNHYRGLVGVVRKAYKTSEVAVEIEVECLAEDVWKRHMQTRDQMRLRWLEGLTDEARRKLKPEQKSFDLRYVVLVSGAIWLARSLRDRRADRKGRRGRAAPSSATS